MGAAGSPYAAFRRAVEARNLTRALTETRELPQISLADAAELVVLAADDHGPSFERWAGRWLARQIPSGERRRRHRQGENENDAEDDLRFMGSSPAVAST